MILKWKASFYVGMCLLLAVLYFPVLQESPILQFDDQNLILPLQDVHSFEDYWQRLSDNRILDLQPVRDLTFWTELQVENSLGTRNSHLVNLIIWLLILAVSARVMESLAPGSPWNPFLLLLLAAHPVASTSVAWVASRKHLLSALFVLLATWLTLLRGRRNHWSFDLFILMSFLLSVFSQPISLAWPAWFFVFVFYRQPRIRPRDWVLLGFLGLISISAAYLNYRYYTGDLFLQKTPDSPPKINEESFRNLWNRLLVLGRYTFQILIPIRPVGLPYWLWQWPSYVGMGLLSSLLIAQWKFRFFKNWTWILFLCLPIAVMTIRLTHHAGYDTYILVSLIGVSFLLAESLRHRKLQKSVAVGLLLILALFSYGTHLQAQRWTSDEGVFAQAYESEGTLLATTGYVKLLLERKDLKRGGQLIEELLQKDPENREIPNLLGRWIFLNDLPSSQKRELFALNERNHPWYQYYFAAFEASEGLFNEAFLRLQKCWQLDPDKFRMAVLGNGRALSANWKKICQSAQRTDCHLIPSLE